MTITILAHIPNHARKVNEHFHAVCRAQGLASGRRQEVAFARYVAARGLGKLAR